MKLTWVNISDSGKKEERLHFKAVAPLDLTYYAVFDTSATDDQMDDQRTPKEVFASQKTCYWFVSKQIAAGENVVLYTRAGTPSTETRADGVYHFLFRGSAVPLYTSERASPVLIEITTWRARRA